MENNDNVDKVIDNKLKIFGIILIFVSIVFFVIGFVINNKNSNSSNGDNTYFDKSHAEIEEAYNKAELAEKANNDQLAADTKLLEGTIVASYKKEVSSLDDYTLNGYFKDGVLLLYEYTHIVEFESNELAEEGFETLLYYKDEGRDKKDTERRKTLYVVDNNILIFKERHYVDKIDNLDDIFYSTDGIVTEDLFEKYAISNGFTLF